MITQFEYGVNITKRTGEPFIALFTYTHNRIQTRRIGVLLIFLPVF